MKPTLVALFALSVAVFADEDNRFQIITHINLDGSRVLLKLDRQTGKTWRYESRRVGPEIIVSDEGQDIQERLGKIIIQRVDQLFDFTMEEAIESFKIVVERNDHLQHHKPNSSPNPKSSGGESKSQPKTNRSTVQPEFKDCDISTNSIPNISAAGNGRPPPPGQPGIGLHGIIPTNRLPMIPGGFAGAFTAPGTPGISGGLPGGVGTLPPSGIPGGIPGVPNLNPLTGIPFGNSNISTNRQTVTRKPHAGPHLNITFIQGFPHRWNSAINPATGLPLGGGGVGGAINVNPTTGKPILDSNSTGKLRPNRQPGVGGGAPMIDPTTGFPIGAGVGGGLPGMGGGLPGMGGGLPGMGGGLPGMGGGLPGMGGGSSESTYEFDPTTVKVRGLKSEYYNISAFSLLHMVLNSLDYPIQCVIDRHGIFLMPIGHPFNFLNGKPAKTKSTDRWVLVGQW